MTEAEREILSLRRRGDDLVIYLDGEQSEVLNIEEILAKFEDRAGYWIIVRLARAVQQIVEKRAKMLDKERMDEMTLAKGDHLVIKRNGMILTPDCEMNHEFEVISDPDANNILVFADGTPCPTAGNWYEGKQWGKDYFTKQIIEVKVVK